MKQMSKTLVYDIETAPIVGTVWGKYEQNLIWTVQDWYMLCFAYKWLGDKTVHVVAQPDFKGYKAGSIDDYKVIEKLWQLFNEANVVVAHNGNSFDQKKAQARMILHGFDAPTSYQQIDTKLVAKRYFNFTSNKLDDLGEYFKLGKKYKTDASLWRDCMAGDKKAWDYMKKYNKQDVILLEKVYLKMRPWDTQHPNMANITGMPDVCRVCTLNVGFIMSGFKYTKTGKYRRFQCKNCRSYNQSPKAEKVDKPNYV